MAVIGGALSADCAPRDANYRMFYDACAAPAWQVRSYKIRPCAMARLGVMLSFERLLDAVVCYL
jgi:hypothetical protein